jgi:FMN-dependent NADH-azoreductase
MKPHILRVDASSRLDGSYSRQIGDIAEKALVDSMPGVTVNRRDLGAQPVEHIRNVTIAGYYTPAENMTAELTRATKLSDAVIEEVKAATVLLITTPMYNFSIPSALKAWIDQLVRIGQTFAYDGKSFTGLLPGKKAYVVVAYGAGGYTNSGPFAAADFVQPYMKFLLNFLGITDVTFITMERTTADPDAIAEELAKAREQVRTSLFPGQMMAPRTSDGMMASQTMRKGPLQALIAWFWRPRDASRAT